MLVLLANMLEGPEFLLDLVDEGGEGLGSDVGALLGLFQEVVDQGFEGVIGLSSVKGLLEGRELELDGTLDVVEDRCVAGVEGVSWLGFGDVGVRDVLWGFQEALDQLWLLSPVYILVMVGQDITDLVGQGYEFLDRGHGGVKVKREPITLVRALLGLERGSSRGGWGLLLGLGVKRVSQAPSHLSRLSEFLFQLAILALVPLDILGDRVVFKANVDEFHHLHPQVLGEEVHTLAAWRSRGWDQVSLGV